MVGVLTADLSDVRLEEVARLRMAIDSGCYRIPASDLADRLIASAACGWGADRRKFD
jgi:anti-sigma28 factor (negative regulator of flagellin synthesis)